MKEERLADEEGKDDEERRLESLLFGVKYHPGRVKDSDEISDQEGDDSEEDKEEKGGMRHLLNQDVCDFFF
jgi:U3 small nucleolar RNA-associated protein 18